MKTNIIHCLKNVIDLDQILESSGLHLKRKSIDFSVMASPDSRKKPANVIDEFIIKNRLRKTLMARMRDQ